jgi:hypothetical protein
MYHLFFALDSSQSEESCINIVKTISCCCKKKELRADYNPLQHAINHNHTERVVFTID